MKRTLRIVAAAIVLAAATFWAASGANRGWTKTSVPTKTVDDVTGIEGVTYTRKFVPGLDFLALGVLGAVFLAGVSFLIPKKQLEPGQ
jgi:hypothetical protein